MQDILIIILQLINYILLTLLLFFLRKARKHNDMLEEHIEKKNETIREAIDICNKYEEELQKATKERKQLLHTLYFAYEKIKKKEKIDEKEIKEFLKFLKTL